MSTELFEIEFIGKKYKCCNCPLLFNTLDKLDKHLKLNCTLTIKYDDIYKLNPKTLANFIFEKELYSGQIHIISYRRSKDIFNIGISKKLLDKVNEFREIDIIEPLLHCYFPCKNIYLAYEIIKLKLKKYHFTNDFYKGNLIDFQKEILFCIREINGNKDYIFEPEIKKNDISKCTNCNKFFATQEDLKKHLLVHDHKLNVIKKNNNIIVNTNNIYETTYKNFVLEIMNNKKI